MHPGNKQLYFSNVISYLALMFLAGIQLTAQSGLTTTPTSPIAVSANHRYFTYGGQTVALVGMSGEYLPHVSQAGATFKPQSGLPAGTPTGKPTTSYCTYDANTNFVLKYKRCLSILTSAGMNKMRLWVSLDSSPGRDVTSQGVPYSHEQPFPFSSGKWDLTSTDPTFYSNLFNVVSYAQSQGVIVEVTLFDPAAGTSGPWTANNNVQNQQFTIPDYFAESDGCASPPTGQLDCQGAIRSDQVTLIQNIVAQLYSLDNLYYELANEPDLAGKVFDSRMVAWHKFMANVIWNKEGALGTAHHLIAANLSYGCPNDNTPLPCSSPGAIDALIANDPTIHIDIVNGHYVTVTGTDGTQNPPGSLIPAIDRYGAIDLVRRYNLYNKFGAQATWNNRIWGFNEGRVSGFFYPGKPDCAKTPIGPDCQFFAQTPDGVRAQAWEFFVDGGGTYDNFSYDWGNLRAPTNPNPTPNDPDTDVTIPTQLGGLSSFINTLPSLSSMFRFMSFSTTPWINPSSLPAYGSGNTYWAAMQNNSDTYLYYEHHSALGPSGIANTLYAPVTPPPLNFARTLSIQNLALCSTGTTTFTANWYLPEQFSRNNFPVMPGGTTSFHTSTATLNTPMQGFRYDVLLKISRACT